MRALALIVIAISLAGCGGMPESGTLLQPAAEAPIPQPAGFAAYCTTPAAAAAKPFWDAFCHGTTSPQTVTLTPERWGELRTVQAEAEASIRYHVANSWDPLSDVGDCKNYAARMALLLLDEGWPAGSLRIATAFVNDGSFQEGASHAVLLVDTDRGTMVLDSRQQAPLPWRDLSYVWLSAEVPGRGGTWSQLTSDSDALKTALLASIGRREQLASQ